MPLIQSLILLPAAAGVAILMLAGSLKRFGWAVALTASAGTAVLAAQALGLRGLWSGVWAGPGLTWSFRCDALSAFIAFFAALFVLAGAVYSAVFMKGKPFAGVFYAFLMFSLSLANGAVFADNLVVMLFFWEALLVTLFVMIAVGRAEAWKTAAKALILVGISDVCLMVGIGLAGALAGTFDMSRIRVETDLVGSVAFVLLALGATAKAGCLPFHTWIPDAAEDAPLPFMAVLPAALEKLLGIYFLTRISLEMFNLKPGSGLSVLLMSLGAVTILIAVLMALVQKNFKRLLAYHAVSQVGYMVLGIGTAMPVGIVGGLFHMINHTLYKSGLFFSSGCVERQTGTTDLEKLGGLARRMPVTTVCFLVCAAAISGVPPLNGFFSKELVYDAAFERHWIFYLAAVAGSFFTAVSFLKLGHAAFFGKCAEACKKVVEAPIAMLAPLILIALTCVGFGVFNSLPLNVFIVPAVGIQRLHGHQFGGWPAGPQWLVLMTIVVLALAAAHHALGVRLKGSGLKSADIFCQLPGLKTVYEKAKHRAFDPYEIGLRATTFFSQCLWRIDRLINAFYDTVVPSSVRLLSQGVRFCHNGSYRRYVGWALGAAGLVMFIVLRRG
ncbi:MAG: complex I subunit 5 family protein [Candidatus Omnitrophota bacterium]